MADETKNIEVDAELEKAIADKVVEGLSKTVDTAVEKRLNEVVTEKLTEIEKTIQKTIPDKEADDGVIKELRFMKAAIALVKGDKEAVAKYNERSIGLLQKAGYANTDVNADGGYIVADPEFEAAIEALSEDYGVAFREADVRPISRNSIKTNKRGSNVVMYETSQGAQKTGTKLTIEQMTVELRKFAAIAVATDELIEDAAIDFWQDVTLGFAEERARIADEMVFTDTNVTYPGILRTAGVFVKSVGATISLINWDDLMDAEVAIPTKAAQNGKHYMHRTVWNIVRQSKDDQNRYQLMPSAGLQTPWGTPVVLVDVLPSSSVVGDSNEPYTVFGDLKRVKLYVRRGLVLDQSRDASVHDADGNAVSLYEKDMTALRAVTRMVALVKFPEAFCVIGTGTVS